MVALALVLLFCIAIFLFTLFVLSREDFVFLRKNISLYETFDVAFIVLLASFFFSRLFYVILHFKSMYLNPLVFFLIPYFPGLSLLGGVLGGILTLFILTKRHKYPRGRFFDFFAFAFLAALPLGSLGFLLGEGRTTWFLAALPILYYLVLFIFALKVLLPRFLQGQMRDGMLGSLILMNYSLFSCIYLIIASVQAKTSVMSIQLVLLLVLFFLSLFYYLRQGLSFSLRR